jgi:hypothetical protein
MTDCGLPALLASLAFPYMSDPIDAFLDAAFWKGSTDDADAVLARHPDLAAASIHAAATLGDDDPSRPHGLVDAGADPNTGFFAEDHAPDGMWERALYAAADVAHHPELTRLLLERGTDPNDPEVAYHSPETSGAKDRRPQPVSNNATPRKRNVNG